MDDELWGTFYGKKSGLAESPACDFVGESQTIEHEISDCPKLAFHGTIDDVLQPSPEGSQ